MRPSHICFDLVLFIVHIILFTVLKLNVRCQYLCMFSINSPEIHITSQRTAIAIITMETAPTAM